MPQAYNPLVQARSCAVAARQDAGEDPKAAKLNQAQRTKREKEVALRNQDYEAMKTQNARVVDPVKVPVVEVEGPSSSTAVLQKPCLPMLSGPEDRVLMPPSESRGEAVPKVVKDDRPVTPRPTTTRRKPAKGMQLDAIYREYHRKFLEETAILTSYVDKYTGFTYVCADEIVTELIIGDIESLVGQCKLLLESKLPQFAELLYFYLSRHADPHPLHPCDLEGWWAVAELSIDCVKDGFRKVENAMKACTAASGSAFLSIPPQS